MVQVFINYFYFKNFQNKFCILLNLVFYRTPTSIIIYISFKKKGFKNHTNNNILIIIILKKFFFLFFLFGFFGVLCTSTCICTLHKISQV